MTEFLIGGALGDRIRNIARGGDARLAVAFWGKGAAGELFGPGHLDRDDLRIVCDLGMGATNPEALAELGAPRRDGLRHRPGLHGKVYLSAAGLVVGSANASSNGIGLGADPAGLIEVGTFSAAGSPAWQAAAAWFETLWARAEAIDAAAMDSAWANWRLRSIGRDGQAGGRADAPVRSIRDYDPDRDGLVHVCWYDDAPAVDEPRDIPNLAYRNDLPLCNRLARDDTDVLGSWMLDVFLDEDNGHAMARPAPELFFLNARLDDYKGDEDYPILYYQRTDAPLPPAPFRLDNQLCRVVVDVINRDEFGALRDVQDAEPWRIADHLDLMRAFWSAVRQAHPRG